MSRSPVRDAASGIGRPSVGQGLLAVAFIAAGVAHLVAPAVYDPAMPPGVPFPRAMILVSGIAEIAGGIGLLIPSLRVAAGWGLALLLIAVYPANVWMALDGSAGPSWALWARLPLQGVLVAVVLRASGAYSMRVNVPGHANSARARS
ncbi:MAG: DoxX family protein [Bacteroidota bacterium]